MSKTLTPLTEEEKALAEEKHDFIFKYLRVRGLTDDYYDVVVEPFLKAVRVWFARPELHKYTFETIAASRMNKGVAYYRQMERRLHDRFNVIFLDACVGESQNVAFSEYIPDSCIHFTEIIEQREIIHCELQKMPAEKAAKLIDFCSASKRKAKTVYQRKGEPNRLVECGCGCGAVFLQFGETGLRRDFLPGHKRKKKKPENPDIPCKCGCGQLRPMYDAKGCRREYIAGHQREKRPVMD